MNEIAKTAPNLEVAEFKQRSLSGMLDHLPPETRMWFDPIMLQQAERMANAIASSNSVPRHLRGDQAAALDVMSRSLATGVPPMVIAQNQVVTHPGSIPTYFGTLVIAIINASPRVKGGLQWRFLPSDEEWERRVVGKFEMRRSKKKMDEHGNPVEYPARAYTDADEEGLSIEVWAAVKDSGGEFTERRLKVTMKSTRANRFSTLWATDPATQLFYRAARNFGRQHVPEVMAGVRMEDDWQTPMRDITPTVEATPQVEAMPLDANRPPAEAAPARQSTETPCTPEQGRTAQETPAQGREGEDAASTSPSAGPGDGEQTSIPLAPDSQAMWDGESGAWINRKVTDRLLGEIKGIIEDQGVARARAVLSPSLTSHEKVAPLLVEPGPDPKPSGPAQDDTEPDADPVEDLPTVITWAGQEDGIEIEDEFAVATAIDLALRALDTEAKINELMNSVEPGRDYLPTTLVEQLSRIYTAHIRRIRTDAERARSDAAPLPSFDLGSS